MQRMDEPAARAYQLDVELQQQQQQQQARNGNRIGILGACAIRMLGHRATRLRERLSAAGTIETAGDTFVTSACSVGAKNASAGFSNVCIRY